MDPTLPRINTIKCPNQACKSNEGQGQGQGQGYLHQEKPKLSSRSRSSESGKSKASSPEESSPEEPEVVEVVEEQEGDADAATDREIIYLRYDDVNMNFVYLCPVCDSVWNTTQ